MLVSTSLVDHNT